ncbi:MAG: hypothetical protein ACRD4B_10785, partial [Acidobacteriota bacterium]
MKHLGLLAICLLVLITTLLAQQSEYVPLKAEAEKFYREGSYARAHELYKKADSMTLSADESRWVDFRIADTLWRSQQATQTSDPTVFERAQTQLQALLTVEEPDQVFAEAHESLGDFFWMRRDARNWSMSWQGYQQALEW